MRGKVDFRRLSRKERMLLDRELWGTLGRAKHAKELIGILKGLLTVSEQVMLARRIQIGTLLLQGATHEAIRRKLRVGFATIQGVDRWIAQFHPSYRRDLALTGASSNATISSILSSSEIPTD